MSFAVEYTCHYDGQVDQSHYGFSRVGPKLVSASSMIDLISMTNPEMIFGSYETRRSTLMREAYAGKLITGYWDETLF